MVSLSPTQVRALEKLEHHDGPSRRGTRCAYCLRESTATLDALVRRGLASESRAMGALAFPRVCRLYTVTAEGRAWLRRYRERGGR
jgi:DNA-binding MarR family transcriptional regulator